MRPASPQGQSAPNLKPSGLSPADAAAANNMEAALFSRGTIPAQFNQASAPAQARTPAPAPAAAAVAAGSVSDAAVDAAEEAFLSEQELLSR